MTDSTPAIDRDHAALLVMDYQPGIVDMVSDGAALVRRMAETIAVARARGVRIGYVRVAFDEADYDAIPSANKSFSGIAAARRMPDGSSESAVHPDLAPAPGDIVVRKTRVGAFSTTDLDRQLRDRGIDTLILAGISTSGVVLSTVRDAADRDYRVYVLEDGSADPDGEVHALLTKRVFPRQAYVISVAELPKLLPVE